MKFDTAVIGGGPGGLSSALELGRKGYSAALIEKRAPGGMAINQGYFISKVLLDLARDEKTDNLEEMPGIINLRRETARTHWNIELQQAGVAVYSGEARLIDKNKIEIISGKEEKKQIISAERIILATGNRPVSPLDFPADPGKGIITYREVMAGDWVDAKKIVILGGDVEGCEFACLFQQLGSEVFLLEQENRLLPGCDPEIAGLLEEKLAVKGINIKTSSTVESYRSLDKKARQNGQGSRLRLICHDFGEEASFEVDAEALLLTGGAEAVLPPGAENLRLARTEEGFIEVDSSFSTSLENIYAAGDVIGGIASANAAIMEGKAAARSAVCENFKIDYQNLPYVFFTSPQVTGIGLREVDIDDNNSNISIKRAEFTENLRALTLGSGDGKLKLIISEKDNILLGAHAIGENAGELHALLTLVVRERIPLKKIEELPLAHPSLNELIIKALEK